MGKSQKRVNKKGHHKPKVILKTKKIASEGEGWYLGVLIKGQSVRPQIGLRFKVRWAKNLV